MVGGFILPRLSLLLRSFSLIVKPNIQQLAFQNIQTSVRHTSMFTLLAYIIDFNEKSVKFANVFFFLISKSCNCGNYPIILAELTLKNFDKEIKHFYAQFVWREWNGIRNHKLRTRPAVTIQTFLTCAKCSPLFNTRLARY